MTVIIPTLGDNDDFSRCILSIAACNPNAIIVVTPKKTVSRLQKLCESLNLFDVKVLGAQKANKRLQMVQGLNAVHTVITVFADDDVFWPKTFLTYLLAPLEDPDTGAVGGYTWYELYQSRLTILYADADFAFLVSNDHRNSTSGTS